ncbi:15280_t:CDS:2 [Acaulospora morrowiae]|uniref:15280_t:CDS:1 n=1 Tax=Acaulospora morrowiae TaxID=94023 RepID=A0A9N9G025_9GLOM|nr:15280_t:CDS:2 [Acaulospora morrowiae]
MEFNKDEALRCLEIAREKLTTGDVSGAIKFAQKSINLFPTTEAEVFLKRAESAKTTNDRGGSSRQSPSKSPSSPSREHNQGRQTRDYTPEQAEAVKRIRSCDVNDYYAILSISKESSDAEIKKAYRKLALQMHPDKNGAPGADEAFKMVGKAFQILSDPQKRAIYDEHGADPDSRSTGMPSGFGGTRFSNGFASGTMFTDEISPEEIFNMFFSGDGFHSATFVGPGFSARRFQPRRESPNGGRAREQNNTSPLLTFFQLLPLILLFIFTFSSNWLTPTPEPMPAYSLHQSRYYPESRHTRSLDVPYFVEPNQFASFAQNPRKLQQFEDSIEIRFVKSLTDDCNNEFVMKQRKVNEAKGWLFPDEEKLKDAQNTKLPSCEKLMELSKSQRYKEIRSMMVRQ